MNKIFFYLLAIGMLVFHTSCKKESRTIKKETEQDKMIENAKNAVRQIKNIDGNTLNWSTATVNRSVSAGTAVEIRVWNMAGDEMFTYYNTGAMKMYQWKGEVHLVPDIH